MNDKELREIREKIACPQFGDNHYGEWGILRLDQRKTILKTLDYIASVKEQTVYEFAERLKYRTCCIPQHHFTYAEVEQHIDYLAKDMGVRFDD